MILAPAGVCVRVAVYQEVDGASQAQQIWCSVCDSWSSLAGRVLQDPFGSESGTFLAGRVISISGLFSNTIGEDCVDNLFGSRPPDCTKQDCICCAVTSHTALVKWTHCGAHHQGTADPLGDEYRLMLKAEWVTVF